MLLSGLLASTVKEPIGVSMFPLGGTPTKAKWFAAAKVVKVVTAP